MRKLLLLIALSMQFFYVLHASSGEINIEIVEYPVSNSQKGSANISWTSEGVSQVLLCTYAGGKELNLYGTTLSGSYFADWFSPITEYTFRLYEIVNGERVKLLAERDFFEGNLNATVTQYPETGVSGIVNLDWASTGYTNLIVSIDGDEPVDIASETLGGNEDYEIQSGHQYTFSLKVDAADSRGIVLEEITLPRGSMDISFSPLVNDPEHVRTTITWSAVGCTNTQLWVDDGNRRQIVACYDVGGEVTADWVNKNDTYTFYLYGLTDCNANETVLLDQVVVPSTNMSLNIQQLSNGNEQGQVKIDWSSNVAYTNTQIRVTEEGQSEELGYCSENTNGTLLFSVNNDKVYTFALYGTNDCLADGAARLLQEIVLPVGELDVNVLENPNTSLRTIDLNWSSRSASNTQVWLKKDGEREMQLARGTTSGTVSTSLDDNASYTVRLYSAIGSKIGHKRYLLDEYKINKATISSSQFSFNGDGIGTSTITWTSSSDNEVEVCVHEEGEDELILYSGNQTNGSLIFSNIEKGTFYTFKIYESKDGVRKSLLDKIKVPYGRIETNMHSIPVSSGSFATAHLKWNTSGYPYSQVWVQVGNGAEKIMSCTYSSGSSNPSWIKKGDKYTFRLYAATGCSSSTKGVLLDEIQVTALPPVEKLIGVNKVNLLNQYYGISSGLSSNPSDESLDVVKRLAEKSIKDASDLGFGFMRVYVSFFSGNQVTYWKDNKTKYFAAVDEMLAALQENDMKIVPVLNFNIAQFPENSNESIYEMFINPNSESKILLAEFISDFVNRYKTHPAILFWELSNEVNLKLDMPHIYVSGGDDKTMSHLSTDVWKIHMKWMCDEIRKHDLTHMISSGNTVPRPYAYNMMQNGEWSVLDDYSEFKKILYEQNKECDIVSIHAYKYPDNLNYQFGFQGDNYFEYITEAYAAVNEMNKLLYIGEYGDGQTLTNPEKEEPIEVLEQIKVNQIPYSSIWVWEYLGKSTYQEDSFCIDPVHSHTIIDKMIEVNASFGNEEWLPDNADVISPITILSYPFSNTGISENSYIWTKVSDNNREIDRIELYLDGELQNSSTDFPYRNLLSIDGLEESMHMVEVKAYDIEENIGTDCIMLYKGIKRPKSPTVIQKSNPLRNEVSWDDCDVLNTEYIIKRRTNGGAVVVVGTVGGSNVFIDNNINENDSYEYILVSSQLPEVESAPSSFVELKSDETIITLANENSISIYPNPTNGVCNMVNIASNSKINIYNSIGLQIYETIATSDIIEIDLSSFLSGMYLVKIENSENVVLKYLIVN